MTERSVFIAALDIQDYDERSAYLDDACHGDPRLRERVGALLRAHADAAGFMERPVAECVAMEDAPRDQCVDEPAARETAEAPGTRIGHYRLLQQIGEGAFGVVYLAEQVEPVRRNVAVKIIKPGMDTKEVIARFEAERQALAMMDHPNIARVLDAGTVGVPASAGSSTTHAEDRLKPGLQQAARPYFVMELVTGVPITEYCDLNQATVRERLTLFTAICRAVQHAHQKGIIHRDLKPSNILVTLQDGRPVPKVIDFGVAKALKHELTERTLFTAYGQLIGTPAYMSPEQAELNGADVDTRSDIYALGVLLYELLTGRTPLDAERLRAASFSELLRIIREEEPLRPSAQLAESNKPQADSLRKLDLPNNGHHECRLALVARQRGADPQRLQREVAGDLDWIVMKALEKDRTRRFETAAALARDVERCLQGEAVEARPPSRLYQFRKFARRHQREFYLATSVVVLLALTIVGLLVTNIRIRAEQMRTAAERDRAESAHRLADDRANETTLVLEQLQTASALVTRARVYANWLQWDDADLALSRAIQLRPEYAAARKERANLYAQLGLWELAAADLAKAIEVQEPDTSDDWYSHALLCRQVGDAAGYHRACAKLHELFDGTNRRTFAMDVIRACTIGPDAHGDPAQLVESAQAVVAVEPNVREYLYILGVAHYRAGQFESAIQRLREAAAIDPSWRSRPITYPVLAMAYHSLGEFEEAHVALDDTTTALDEWTRERYDIGREVWVIHQGATAVWPVPWQDWLQCQLQLGEAREVFGLPAPSDDPRLHELRGRAFAGLRRYDNANVEFGKALEIQPDDSDLRAQAHHSRAYSHSQRDQWDQAAQEFARAGELRPEEPYLLHFQAVSHLANGDMDAFRRACAAMLERFGSTQDPRVAHSVVELCTLVPNAVPDLARLLPAARVASEWYPGASRFYGAALYRCGEYQAAIEQLRAADKLHRADASDLFFMGMAQHRQGNIDEAQRLLSAAVAWIEQADRHGTDDLRRTRPAWGRWDQRVVFPHLRREAETLVLGKTAAYWDARSSQ